MGDPSPKNTAAIPISFPPGFQFYPTEEHLLCYYLTLKNSCDKRPELDFSLPSSFHADFSPFGFEMVREINLYEYDPCDLPDISCFPYGRGGSKKHWYCFTGKVSSGRVKRKAGGGFWKRKGRARDVVGGKEGIVLGKKKTFEFYRGNLSRTVKTDWVLYEYALVDNLKDSFCLCRVFKSCPGTKLADHVPSSCTDKSIAAMRDNKQHYGASTSGIGEVSVHADTSFGTKNEIQRLLTNSISEQYDSVLAQQTSDDAFRFPMTVPWPDQLVESSNGIVSGGTIFFGNVTDQLVSNSVSLEGDFIELNDLISRLPDMDSVG
ncbi:NAC domain-containing protein 72-like [Macadamia integrifolia]|uniref:NAC domain-containing protein 72-like n=1 Tax=Macadamia integrifolia TaxID=60698 RepID=UPI001C4FB7CF|nr:NAC domain-containing protein 72-like [Macadamia integrifolia]